MMSTTTSTAITRRAPLQQGSNRSVFSKLRHGEAQPSRSAPQFQGRLATVVRCRASKEERQLGQGNRINEGAQRFFSGIGVSRGVLPTKLMGNTPKPKQDQNAPEMTVYSIRVTTSTERGSQFSSMYGGIWMCLIGEDGSSVMHRFSPVVDPEDLREQLNNICESDSWEDMGANCGVSQPPQAPSKSPVKRRFNEGSVDEESFMAPDLGPLAAIIVGPEEGAWRLHEVNISSSRTGHSDRFVSRERMGEGQRDRSAAYLTPVPTDAVVYGSGESAVILSKGEAARLNSASMQDYSGMKQQLLQTNLALVGSGSGIMALAGGSDSFAAFGVGGILGLLYQISLQSAVDSLPSSIPKDYDTNPMHEVSFLDMTSSALSTALSKPPARFLISAGAAACAFYAAELISSGGAPEVGAKVGSGAAASGGSRAAAGLFPVLLTMTAGFMMHKVSLIAVTMQPIEPVKQAQGIIAKKKAE